jgi:hypothetical protein
MACLPCAIISRSLQLQSDFTRLFCAVLIACALSKHPCRNASDSSSDPPSPSHADAFSSLRSRNITAAPAVDTSDLVYKPGLDGPISAQVAAEAEIPAIDAKILKYNPTVDELYGGVRSDALAVNKALRNHAAGHVEDFSVSSVVFDEQYNRFHAKGVAQDMSGTVFGNVAAGTCTRSQ